MILSSESPEDYVKKRRCQSIIKWIMISLYVIKTLLLVVVNAFILGSDDDFSQTLFFISYIEFGCKITVEIYIYPVFAISLGFFI